MPRQASLHAIRIQPLRRAILAATVLALAMPTSAQTISTQAISEPGPLGIAIRFFSPDGRWVCFSGDSVLCAPSNASALARLNQPLQPSGPLTRRPQFIPGTNRMLYSFTSAGGTRRLWMVAAGHPQSAVDITPQWPAADIENWVVSDEGDIVLFVDDGGDRAIYRTRFDAPESFVEIGSNITIGSAFLPGRAQFEAGNQAVHAWLEDRQWRIPLNASPATAVSQLGAIATPQYDALGGQFYFRAEITGNRVDLFRIPVTGGVAQSLNLDTTHSFTTRPFFSPDGQFACFFERRTEFDLACSDLRGSNPQTLGWGAVATNISGGPAGQHIIVSDSRTLFGICSLCSGPPSLYRASVDGSIPFTVLTGTSVGVVEVRHLPDIERILFRVLDNNSSKLRWQSTTYDFTDAVDYPFDGEFVGYDTDSDRLAFLTDVNPFPGVELQLVSVRSDGSSELALTGDGFSNGIASAAATMDGAVAIVSERYLEFPSLSEGVRLVRTRIDGSDTRVLGSFPRTGNSTPTIIGAILSPTDPFGTAFELFDGMLSTQVITYSGTPAPMFHDGFESAP